MSLPDPRERAQIMGALDQLVTQSDGLLERMKGKKRQDFAEWSLDHQGILFLQVSSFDHLRLKLLDLEAVNPFLDSMDSKAGTGNKKTIENLRRKDLLLTLRVALRVNKMGMVIESKPLDCNRVRKYLVGGANSYNKLVKNKRDCCRTIFGLDSVG